MKQKAFLRTSILAAAHFTIMLTNAPPAYAQTMDDFTIDPKIIASNKATMSSRSATEIRNDIIAIQDRSLRVTKLLLFLISANEAPDIRSELAGLLFEEQVSKEGVNRSHFKLLSNFYLTIISKPTPATMRPRTFIGDHVLVSRLLDFFGSILEVENERAELPSNISPESRLLLLLKSAAAKHRNSYELLNEIHQCQRLIGSVNTSLNSVTSVESGPRPEAEKSAPDSTRPQNKHLPSQPPASKPGEQNEEQRPATIWLAWAAIIVFFSYYLWFLLKRR